MSPMALTLDARGDPLFVTQRRLADLKRQGMVEAEPAPRDTLTGGPSGDLGPGLTVVNPRAVVDHLRCSVCGHVWLAKFNQELDGHLQCPVCGRFAGGT